MTGELPHLNPEGEVHMVDVGGKDVSVRRATAEARVRMSPGLTERLPELPSEPWQRSGSPGSWPPRRPPN